MSKNDCRKDARSWLIGPDQLEAEVKYTAPAHQTTATLRMLERFCDPDPEFAHGVVSSIYYDSRSWDYLGEKRNSEYLKTKVRVRWYEGTDGPVGGDDPSFAEMKYRVGSKRAKRRIETGYRGAELAAMSLCDRELLKIPAALIAAGAPIHRTLFPAFVVRYCRRRFVDRTTGARMCVDYAIAVPRVNRQMMALGHRCELGETVLEVKQTEGRVPYGLWQAMKLGYKRAAFSKYYECFRRLTGGAF